MDERENLPAKLAAQGLAATTEKRGSLVARGIVAVLANKQQALTKNNDAIYRQAREIYDELTNVEFHWREGYLKSEPSLSEAIKAFLQLANEGYGKTYFPLSTLCTLQNLWDGDQLTKNELINAKRFHKLADDWLHANQHLNDPEIWHDLGALYINNDVELSIRWFQKAADVGDVSSMWGLVGAYEYKEDWSNALYWQIKAAKAENEAAQIGLEQQHEEGDLETKIDDE